MFGQKSMSPSNLMSNAEGWFRWFPGEGWVRVAGPEEGAKRCPST